MTKRSLEALCEAAELQNDNGEEEDEGTNITTITTVTEVVDSAFKDLHPLVPVIPEKGGGGGEEDHSPLSVSIVREPVADPTAVAAAAAAAVNATNNVNPIVAADDIPTTLNSADATENGAEVTGKGTGARTGNNKNNAATCSIVADTINLITTTSTHSAAHHHRTPNPIAVPMDNEMTSNHQMEFTLDENVAVAKMPPLDTTTITTTYTTGGVTTNQDDENERIQQEAIAAAVVAQGQSILAEQEGEAVGEGSQIGGIGDNNLGNNTNESTTETDIAETTNMLRKRGWVKKTWEERLEELKTYKGIHGHCNVPTVCKINPSLGHWVHDQRKQYRLYKNDKPTSMNPLRISQLEEVGFKWALQRHTTMRSWSERFAQLLEFKTVNGHCNVPIRYKENPSLGQWVSTQRQEYSNYQSGKKSNMNKERIQKLEDAEFCWSLRDTAKMAPRKSWDMHFAALKEFKKENGHCDVRVRSKTQPTGSLGRWVEKQRSQYHSKNEGKDSKLSQDQIEKLDSIGFKWRIRHERNRISGCARNPDMKLDEEALLDEYTKRAFEELKKDELESQVQELQQKEEEQDSHYDADMGIQQDEGNMGDIQPMEVEESIENEVAMKSEMVLDPMQVVTASDAASMVHDTPETENREGVSLQI